MRLLSCGVSINETGYVSSLCRPHPSSLFATGVAWQASSNLIAETNRRSYIVTMPRASREMHACSSVSLRASLPVNGKVVTKEVRCSRRI